MSDQDTYIVPPRVWTELPGNAGYVFSEGDVSATVTVWRSGEITFGAPMRWRPTRIPTGDQEVPVIGIRCICDVPPVVGGEHQQSCPVFSADIERWADSKETDHV